MCIMAVHVDDLKIAGEHVVVQGLLKILEEEFGEPTIQRGKFTNCGVQHTQNPITREITFDQVDFLSRLHAIEHPQLSTGTNEEQCVEGLHCLFISLLGAIERDFASSLKASSFWVQVSSPSEISWSFFLNSARTLSIASFEDA